MRRWATQERQEQEGKHVKFTVFFFFLISARVIGNIYDFWNIFILERESVCVCCTCVWLGELRGRMS